MWLSFVPIAVLTVAALVVAGLGFRDQIGTNVGMWLMWSLITVIWLIGLTSTTVRS